jgi:hypothetical protein
MLGLAGLDSCLCHSWWCLGVFWFCLAAAGSRPSLGPHRFPQLTPILAASGRCTIWSWFPLRVDFATQFLPARLAICFPFGRACACQSQVPRCSAVCPSCSFFILAFGSGGHSLCGCRWKSVLFLSHRI